MRHPSHPLPSLPHNPSTISSSQTLQLSFRNFPHPPLNITVRTLNPLIRLPNPLHRSQNSILDHTSNISPNIKPTVSNTSQMSSYPPSLKTIHWSLSFDQHHFNTYLDELLV
ncbi:hypothetical protein KC19_7G089500 [Ceratodon purpureus]|uniref:Uncharacterized protein n=1 Tax=Ceratodon purpureus TaxID=3225 RepID=A0A8T0H670_CERPU|nr:hypothetical protein KC19_7G089500 [Ceratodon purpureus]